jgi:hypothetical protein
MRAGKPVSIGAVSLVPVERVIVRAVASRAGGWVLAGLEPVALLVRDDRGVWAVDRDAVPVSVESLRRVVPGLEGFLAG